MPPPAEPLDSQNLAYVEALYELYARDPGRVDSAWQAFFELQNAEDGDTSGGATTPDTPTAESASTGGRAHFSRGPSFRPASIFNPPSARAIAHRELALLEHAVRDPQLVGERLPWLRTLALFRDLTQDDLALVAQVARDVVCKAGQALFYTGDEGDGLYIIVEGRMRVQRGGQVIAELGAGEVVGELAIMDQQPRSADAVAVSDVRLLELTSAALDELLDRHGQIARGLFRIVTQRLRETNARQERVDMLIRAYRVRGHMVAKIDPLDRRLDTHPELELAYYGLSDADLDLPFSSRTMHGAKVLTLRRIVQRLRNTYCGSIGAQFMHIDDVRVKGWLQARMEDTENQRKLSRAEQLRIYRKLTDAEVFEQFLHKKYLGAKRFSLEGAESLIPLLDMAVEEAAAHGCEHLVIGMAHRGRLNVLANVMGKRAQQIFEEFEDAAPEQQIGGGDVKYHMGFSSKRRTQTGATMDLSLCFNPSHLEFVGPVVLGRVRAKQDLIGDRDRGRVVPLVIHGDAAFAGQGVVQEMLNMSNLPGYTTGGTIHVIINNQVGFTTPPESSRSNTYATDVARMLDIPIFHVNGEDPEGVAQVIQLAIDFRGTFRRDVVIDMYCYRKYGHNEGDEPTFTQPIMYEAIRELPGVRESYLRNLLELNGISRGEAEEIDVRSRERLEADLARARAHSDAAPSEDADGPLQEHGDLRPEGQPIDWRRYCGGPDRAVADVPTGVPRERLAELLHRTTAAPDHLEVHPKLRRLLQQRGEMAEGKRALDWGGGEVLALASLVVEGKRIRLSGQDSGRGTFNHRHAVLHDQRDGHTWLPLAELEPGQAPFDVWDSPLSEAAVLGFDYGYSLEVPDGLTLWEAQFGDFANGAQVIIDQFLVAAEDKWNQLSGLVLLLPHGMEGQGPEHSSARIERFLNLASEDNIQVVYPTTPAQLFHLLRRQVHRPIRKPLVIMTPKSLLRHPEAVSSLDELAGGGFQKVIADVDGPPLATARRVLLCSGKVYYDLVRYRRTQAIDDVAILRVEQLYPLADVELRAALADCPDETDVRWAQEEPVNMGAWVFMRFRMGGRLFGRLPFRHISRPESASPATGSHSAHDIEQAQLVEAAFAP